MYTLRCKVPSLHNDALASCIQVHPNGSILATSSSDSTIRLWTISSDHQQIKHYKTLTGHMAGINYICFSSNGKYLASSSDDLTIRLWSMENNQCVKVLKGHTAPVTQLKFNWKSTILVSGSVDENIRIWDIIKGKCIKILSAHSDPVSSIDLSYDGTVIVSGSYDGMIRLFDVYTGQCLKTLIDDDKKNLGQAGSLPISYVKFSPNCKYILSSSLNGGLKLWDYMNNTIVKTYLLDQEDNSDAEVPIIASKYSCSTNFVTYDKDHLSILTGSEYQNKMIIFDLQSRKVLQYLDCSISDNGGEDIDPILQTDVYNEGQMIVSISRNGTFTLWEKEGK